MIHWNFTHIFTLLSVLTFSEIIFIETYFPNAFHKIYKPLEIISIAMENEMCGHHCPFHPTICYLLGYLDTIVDNYWITIICLTLIGKILNQLPQDKFIIWVTIHITSLIIFGIVIFSLFNVSLTTQWICNIVQYIMKQIFNNGKNNYLFWNKIIEGFNESFIKLKFEGIFDFSYDIITIIGLDKPIIYIICGLSILFRRSYTFTKQIILPIIIFILSCIIFSYLLINGFFYALFISLITFIILSIFIRIFLLSALYFFFPLFTYSAFSTSCRVIPILELFNVNDDLINIITLLVFVWLMTWMYCWANSKVNLTSVVVIFIGISRMFDCSIEYLVFLFMLTELFTHQINASI
ncbi:hypothetical protein EDI_202730 [Entamoeba dispar SAW760]|uniref:Uncharacterized protein n=1 Tax=Entamoeba dispar (strain ATCC PRA-260 / SAW760) TaxID=370354 RepID=B0ET98_ENTDS|nr:uncharacterized protein EDI_202730 [Entamoeba dispar SAW760]EDR22258.1 hypothetical protein EDI_202730 [Entamoeba dispar SAW760]|eukprot:EDR22258.1 hypothetical protein EDI_202730 [Entamoeba dispar SAW760]